MNKDEHDTSLLYNLISLPKENLETKLIELEKQLVKRTDLNDSFLSKLLTHRRHLKDIQYRLRYHPNEIQKDIVLIDSLVQKEQLGCFHDVAEITEKVHVINEEISLSAIKLGLLDNEHST